MKKHALLFTLASSLLAPSAFANNFSYNFLEFRTAVDPRISGAEFSVLAMENVHLIARVDSQFESDADAAVGVGFNGPINQFADVYGQALLHYIDYPNNSDSETLPEFNIGIRMWLADRFEVTGRVGRLDESSVFHAGVRFHSTQQLSLSAETRNNGIYGPQIAMSVRFQF
ncbi:hypothetical protein [Vibrio taketomensis]|uniref:hypothetical protein n=1 Tax=Vibrio taketomensis TaxID=2572923 RepID=UPI001389BC0A|nr:hypothetical protein [Vibrio taketomensis]